MQPNRNILRLAKPARAVWYSGKARALAGWCALVLYLGLYSPLGVAATALLGSLDPNHHLGFQTGEQGLQLVLRHGSHCTGHHHGAVAKVLTFFAQPPNAVDPDHVIQFAAADSFSRHAAVTVRAPANLEQYLPVPAVSTVSLSRPSASEFSLASQPPDERKQLVCLRSIHLLI